MKIEKTRALEPLETWSRHEIDAPDTCPTGVPDGRTIALSTAVVQVRVGAGFIEGNLVVPQRAARLVGRADEPGIELNRAALARVRAPARLEIVPGATHLFEEPGTLEEVSQLALQWWPATRHPRLPNEVMT